MADVYIHNQLSPKSKRLERLDIRPKEGICIKKWYLPNNVFVKKFDIQKEWMKEYVAKLDFVPNLLEWQRHGNDAMCVYKYIPYCMQAGEYFGTGPDEPGINKSIIQVIDFYHFVYQYMGFKIYDAAKEYLAAGIKDELLADRTTMSYMCRDYITSRVLISKKGKLWLVGHDALRLNQDPYRELESLDLAQINKMLSFAKIKKDQYIWLENRKAEFQTVSDRATKNEIELKQLKKKFKNTINKDVIKNTIGEQQYEFYFNSN